MPRKKMLRVVADPQPKADVAYRIQVTAAEPFRDTLKVAFRHLSSEMEGFTRVVHFRLPITPGSLGGELFRACGITTEEGSDLDPNEIIGAVLTVRFGLWAGDAQPRPVAFESLTAKEIDQ